MKEMNYTDRRDFQILASGNYLFVRYWIISRGTHPCAYIDVSEFRQDDRRIKDLDVHGGITYDEDSLPNAWDDAFEGFESGKSRVVGWDYAHCDDYVSYRCDGPVLSGCKKWTTEEIFAEVKSAIESLYDHEEENKKEG